MSRALTALLAAAALSLVPASALAQTSAPSADAAAGAAGGASPDAPAVLPTTTAPAPAEAPPAAPADTSASGTQLPGGGRELLPAKRLVALYGRPGDPRLGALGQGSAVQVAGRLRALAADYATPGRPVLPAFELLASVAQRSPGPDRMYRKAIDPLTAARWLQVARDAGAYLVLELQGGREDFVAQARGFEGLLRQPDVGVGIDPEWRVGPSGVPGRTKGLVRAGEVNALASYLGGLVAEEDGPQKLLVVHRFTEGMLRGDGALRSPAGVATVVDVDAIGSPAAKARTYGSLAGRLPGVPHGLMLFPKLDGRAMSPQQVLGLDPAPDLIGVQ